MTRVNGRSPQSQGRVSIGKAAPDLEELGSSGLRKSGGQVIEEFLTQLRGPKGRKTLREMAENDAVVAGVLFGFEKVVARLDWHIEAGEEASPADQEAADFIESALHDMSDSWATTLDNIMSMLVFGWNYSEIVYKVCNGEVTQEGPGAPGSSKFNDGKIRWRKWASRGQETLLRWDWDDAGGLVSMTQMDPYGGGVHTIPIEKALLFRTSSRLGNPEGRSLIRSAYRSWYFKKRIEEFEAIGIERDLAGLPVAWVPPEWLSSDATDAQKSLVTAVQQLVQNVKRNDVEGVLFPLQYDENGHKVVDFTLMSSGGSRQIETDKVIARYNQQIAMSVLADFLLLGHEGTGSYALGASKIDLWTMAVEAIARSIAAVVNNYAIPRLLRLNGMTVDNVPTLEFGKVSHVDLAVLGNFLYQASTAGLLVADGTLEAYVRDAADLPAPDPDEPLSSDGDDEEIARQEAETQAKIDALVGQAKADAAAAAAPVADGAGPATQTPPAPKPGPPKPAPPKA